MYLTKIEDDRIIIQCNFVKDNFVKVSALYDTGAQLTVITALSIDPNLTEDDFKDCEASSIKGVIEDNELSVTVYKYGIENFYFGNIHLGYVKVGIVFDERITDNIVGLDVIGRITRLGLANTDEMLFFKDTAEFVSYVKEFEEPSISEKYTR